MIPETFKPAAEARNLGLTQRRPGTVALQPDDNVEGRFAAPERLPDGFYSHYNDSMGTLPDHVPRNPNAPHIPLHPRASFDSMASGFTTSAGNSVYMPRRVESIMGDEDRRKYLVAQASQREAGGAYMEERRRDYSDIYGFKTGMESSDSVNSAGSSLAYKGNHQETYNLQNYSVSRDVSNASTSPGDSPEAPAGDPSNEGDIVRLQLPEAAHTSSDRGPSGRSRAGVAGRSPLGRNSLVRTATGEGSRHPAPNTSGESSMEDNVEIDEDSKSEKRRRNRLTKHRN